MKKFIFSTVVFSTGLLLFLFCRQGTSKPGLEGSLVVGFGNSYSFYMGSSTPTQTITVFQNNLAYNPRNYYVRASSTNFTNKGHNLFYGRGTSAFEGYSPVGSSKFENPLFANPSVHDYSLQSGGPARDTGVLVYAGQQYKGNSPDIGAWEF